jgi:cell wall-associated NlpC family hydrolase
MTEQLQRAAVVQEAVSWLGTPFHFNACVKGSGVACGPFLIAAYAPYALETGLALPVAPAFPRDWHFHTREDRFLNVVASFCRQVVTPQRGDIALFRLGSADRPHSHGAIVMEWPRVIHAYWKGGVQEANVEEDEMFKNAGMTFWSVWA